MKTEKPLFEQIMEAKPTIVKQTHKDNSLNSCDECDQRPRDMLWVFWGDGYQICLDCFFKLSGGTYKKTLEFEVMRR